MTRFLPLAATAHAAETDRVTLLVHLLMLGLFVGWGLYFVWVLVRFRQGRHPRADPSGARGRLAFWTEVGVVAAEALLLVVFAGVARNALAMTVGADSDRDAARTSPAPFDLPARFRQVPVGLALGASAVLGFAAWPLATPLVDAVAALGGAR